MKRWLIKACLRQWSTPSLRPEVGFYWLLSGTGLEFTFSSWFGEQNYLKVRRAKSDAPSQNIFKVIVSNVDLVISEHIGTMFIVKYFKKWRFGVWNLLNDALLNDVLWVIYKLVTCHSFLGNHFYSGIACHVDWARSDGRSRCTLKSRETNRDAQASQTSWNRIVMPNLTCWRVNMDRIRTRK